MKENYQIYLPYQFHWRPQSVGGDSQLPNKKMKTMFLWNMSKSRRLTSTFFPTNKKKNNKPDRATMRPDCVTACIELRAECVRYMERQMDEQTDRLLEFLT